MAKKITMPQLSDTMDSGKILEWKVKEGDKVNRGDILAEVETDKANLEIESFHKGVILKILASANQEVQVGDPIAIIGKEGEDISSLLQEKDSSLNSRQEKEIIEATNLQDINAQGKDTVVEDVKEEDKQLNLHSSSSQRIKASPLAKKLAKERNLNIAHIKGTGPQGRIVKRDIEAFLLNQSQSKKQDLSDMGASSATAHKEDSLQYAQTGEELRPMSKMRQTIAKRMEESVATIPHFYVTVSINMEQVVSLRTILKEREEYKGISFNHFIIKAAAYALTKVSRINCSYKNGQLYQPGHIGIGIVTALDDGLLIPVLHSPDKLSLKDIVFEARALIERARAGRPSSNDLTGGTFSISNMGMFDIESFTAIINPGQGAILAISSIKEKAVVKNNSIIVAPLMNATISVDHRIIDGVVAGTFMGYFKESLENPALLME